MSHNTLLVFEVTILVLAVFLGVEVISKVPAMLHTPLMSGTNAIHGIVIVGAMVVLGLPAQRAVHVDHRVRRRRACVRERRRRLRRHRPDARDVQEARQAREVSGLQPHEPALPGHDRDLHPRAAFSVESCARASRQPDRRGRHARRDRGHVRAKRSDELLGDRARDADRRRLRRVCGTAREDDRDAADGGALQRRRRRRGGTRLAR